VKENGIHYWLASDGRIHGMMSCTETWRPRAWKPNILNFPSFVQDGIKRGISSVLKKAKERGELPEEFEQFIDPANIPSVRSVIDVTDLPPLPGSKGWCLTESDYITAEIRGLAFMSGDENLIRLCCEPDDQFGIPQDPAKRKLRVRLRYADDCGISEQNRDPQFLMCAATKGEIIERFELKDLARDESGNLIHPPHDLHWSLVEWVQEAPRELFNEKTDRTGTGKVGNWSATNIASRSTFHNSPGSVIHEEFDISSFHRCPNYWAGMRNLFTPWNSQITPTQLRC
jgi:hypothetical protein